NPSARRSMRRMERCPAAMRSMTVTAPQSHTGTSQPRNRSGAATETGVLLVSAATSAVAGITEGACNGTFHGRRESESRGMTTMIASALVHTKYRADAAARRSSSAIRNAAANTIVAFRDAAIRNVMELILILLPALPFRSGWRGGPVFRGI